MDYFGIFTLDARCYQARRVQQARWNLTNLDLFHMAVSEKVEIEEALVVIGSVDSVGGAGPSRRKVPVLRKNNDSRNVSNNTTMVHAHSWRGKHVFYLA